MTAACDAPPSHGPAHVYVHVPFCARRCSYCDFAIAVRRVVPVGAFVESLARELDVRFARDASWRATTLYLGGGTPSRLGADGVAATLDVLRSRIDVESDAEVTLEANPDDVTLDAARAWRAAGVNRISLGVQTFDDRALRWMHRVHDAATAIRAYDGVRDAGFENVSLDLIFALPESVPRDWRADVERALALAPDHVALYGLTLEAGTPAGRWRDRGEIAEADEVRYESDFLLAHELALAAGLAHYEVSNFARPGFRSRHNSAYWSGTAYAGLGPGAHGFDGRVRRWNAREYAEWTSVLRAGRDPIAGAETLDAANRAAEAVYLGLRTRDGLAVDARESPVIARWVDAGWAELADGRLRLTPHGWLRLDSLAAALTHHRSR